jgi:orotate phosphoribosyltransferase
MQYPRYGLQLARELARQLLENGLVPTAIVGPALGAIHWEVFLATAFDELLSHGEPIRAIFAERVTDASGDANAFAIRRGIELSPADKVLVVEDVTTTGGSVRKVLNLVRQLGATPIAVAALVDRSGGTIEFDIPFEKLMSLNLESYEPEKCPLCAKAVPIDKPGSSKKA